MKAFWLKKVLSMSPCGRAESAKLELPTDTIQAVAFSHDGRLLAGEIGTAGLVFGSCRENYLVIILVISLGFRFSAICDHYFCTVA